MVNIIARRTLSNYCQLYLRAASALKSWYDELGQTNFENFNQLKSKYPGASIVGDDRVVFNILGNHYRLVVRFVFEYRTIQIKRFGTHAEYDRVDVATVQFKKP